jgi:predicted DNA-binding protein (UPF0251 family)
MDTNILSQELKPLQIEAIRALLEERSQRAAAKKVGISRVTLWRWLKNPLFREAVIAGKRAQIDKIWQEIREGML